MARILSVFIYALALLQIAECMVQNGNVAGGNWVPIARFWFGVSSSYNPIPTFFNYTVTTNSVSNGTEILIYDDQPNSWQDAYNNRNSWSCQQLVQNAKNSRPILPGSVAQEQLFMNESFARHWYVVFADCSGDVNVNYDFIFHNTGGQHTYQFSMELQGFWALSLSFFLFFMFLMAGQLLVAFMLHRATSFHRVVKVLTVSVVLQFFAYMFFLIHFDKYARDGKGLPGGAFFGSMLEYTAHWMFVIMLLLIARGSSESFVLSQRRNALIIVAVFFVLDLIFWIWRSVIANQLLTNPFFFGTAPSIIMLVIRSLLGVYFVLLARFSYMEEGNPERRQFLFRFAIIGSVWFFFEPFIVTMVSAVLSHSLEAYAMDRTVAGFWYTINFLIICVFTFFFYWPSRIGNFYDFSKADVMIGTSSVTSPYETL